jgi:hypothetical protein
MNNLLENRQVLVCYMLHGQDKAFTADMMKAEDSSRTMYGGGGAMSTSKF